MDNQRNRTILHICDYAALYRGNFIDSLESVETFQNNITNVYLFPSYAKHTEAEKWISEMNGKHTVAYIQEENYIKNILLVRHILKKHKVDNIVRHFSDLRIDIAIKFLFNSKKVVRFFHCGYTIDSKLKHMLRRFIWKHNKLVGVSNFTANQTQYAFPDFSVTPILNGIHFERLDKIDPIQKPNGTSLLMLGWNYEGKGVDLAVKVVSELQKKYNLTLRIVGLQNEDKIKNFIRELTGENPSWIQYLPPTNNIGTYYTAADIFLSPSRHEAFGYANIEAAYCKNSIVLSKVDGQGELQINGAYWFESENLEEFTKQLETAILELNTPEKIAQRELVREQVQQIYSLENWSNKLVDLLSQ